MWMKDDEGLIICLFGPCELDTSFNDKKIFIKEITSYPYEFLVTFEITVSEPVDLVLKIRKPIWTKTLRLNVPFEEKKGFICIKKQWKGMEKIILEFEPATEVTGTVDGEIYFTYGPLVLANPIEAIETRTKEYGIRDLCDTHYRPAHSKDYLYNGGSIKKKNGQLVFEAEFFNTKNQKTEKAALVPVGKTILRQVSFKQPVK